MTTATETAPTVAEPAVAAPPASNIATVATLPASGIAVALLEAVKALPLPDQEAFKKLFQAWRSADKQRPIAESPKEGAPVEWPDFAGRIKAIFGDRMIPGDPQEFWDKERGRDED